MITIPLIFDIDYFLLTAFSARMSKDSSPTQGQTVQFSREIINNGGGYNSTSSVYTAPLSGTYTFTWTIRAHGVNYYDTALVVNTAVRDRLLTDPSANDEATSTATKVVSLTAGDRVFIRVHGRYGSPSISSNSAGYSTFSGWMIH